MLVFAEFGDEISNLLSNTYRYLQQSIEINQMLNARPEINEVHMSKPGKSDTHTKMA